MQQEGMMHLRSVSTHVIDRSVEQPALTARSNSALRMRPEEE